MGEFIYMSATDLARLIRSGKATSTEIVKDHLERINKLNPTLNAVVISLAEALAYMPILRTNHVVQGFIPANSGMRGEKQLK